MTLDGFITLGVLALLIVAGVVLARLPAGEVTPARARSRAGVPSFEAPAGAAQPLGFAFRPALTASAQAVAPAPSRTASLPGARRVQTPALRF